MKGHERKRLWIEEFNTPWIAFGGLEIDTVERKGAFVMCRASGGDLELILLELKDAGMAEASNKNWRKTTVSRLRLGTT